MLYTTALSHGGKKVTPPRVPGTGGGAPDLLLTQFVLCLHVSLTLSASAPPGLEFILIDGRDT